MSGFERQNEGLSRPRQLANEALEDLRAACKAVGMTNEDIKKLETEITQIIHDSQEFIPTKLEPCTYDS